MALEIEGLSIEREGRLVVSDFSLSLQPGKVAAVLGANGAGKSELVLGIAGVLPLRAGSVHADGVAIAGRVPEVVRAAGVAAVPEGHRVFSRLSVEDNLRVAGAVLPSAEVGEKLTHIYTLFPELDERRSQIAGTMSGGQQQMLAIGHALMARPRYLLIDEMSLGLAPLIVKRLVGAVSQLVADGVGVLLVEQFTEVALALADTVVVMRMGRTQYAGPASAIRDTPEILNSAYF